MNKQLKIADLYEQCLKKFPDNIHKAESGNEYIKVSGVKVLSYFNEYVNITAISRHYVTKDKYRIIASHYLDDDITIRTCIIDTTNDHTCIKIDSENIHKAVKASELKIGEYIPVHYNGKDYYGFVEKVENLGPWNDYVYDLEVNNNSHMFYANDILIHNSQFINIEPLVNAYLQKYNKTGYINELNKTQLNEMIDELDKFIEEDVNVYIKDVVNKECFTEEGKNIHYSREYVAKHAMFFKKKHYIVHIIKKEDKNTDEFKYSGVSVKKAEIPSAIKHFLKTIYEDTCNYHWTNETYKKYIDEVFEKFKQMDYDEISIYKKYGTEKASLGFMESAKGAGAHAKAVNIYNQLLDDLKIADKYEKINVGEVVRFCYINTDNIYGIDVIGFKDNFPKEFRSYFSINYEKMFTTTCLKSLENYNGIMSFPDYNPNNKALFDFDD